MRSEAEIEAGARAFREEYTRIRPKTRSNDFAIESGVAAALEAADAVAAPAVGVTVDREDLEYALDAWPSAIKTGGWWGPVDRDVFRRLLSALLTAQPADDAGEE